MSTHHTHIETLDVDTAWLREWAIEGIVAIELYLAKYAAFDAYLHVHRDLDSNDGDRFPDA
jgi:hypothetical protein